jgi:cytochrome c
MRIAVGLAAIVWLGAGAALAQDAAMGESIFKRCAACHAVGEGAANRSGPVLNDIFGRKAGSQEGYRYSEAMVEAGEGGLTWTPETLAAFLAAPRDYLKGTKMSFPGLKKPEEAQHLIAYLETFSPGWQGAAEE